MITRGIIGIIVGIFTVVGGTAVFLAATNGASFEAQEVVGQTNIVRINSRTIPVELADTLDERSQGLSDRQSLESGSGMLFVFDEVKPVSFWMRWMHFPLDIVWIRDGKIVGIERNVPIPVAGVAEGDLPLYYSSEAVSHVLEINAGEAIGLSVGDTIEITTIKTI